MQRITKAYWPLIILLALLKFVLPFILQSPAYELQRDEYLYYQQGQHIAWGFMENPPLLSWLGTISSWLGGSVFWIKFWPSLFGSMTLIVSCLITASFGGNRFAQFITGLSIMTGIFLRMHFLFQPNFLDVFFWTLTLYFLITYIQTKKERLLWFIAGSLALGFLGKYSILFIVASLFVPLLFSRHRSLFNGKKTWLPAVIALLIILPNVFWQYVHNWPLVHHMKELQETQLQFLHPSDFIKDQLLFLLTVIFVWISGLIWLFKNKEWRFLFFTYFLVIIVLLLGRGKSYYAAGIYPVLLAAGAVALERWTNSAHWVRYALTSLVLLLTIPTISMSLPIWGPDKLAEVYHKRGLDKMGFTHWEDQKDHELPQDFADMLGWKELTQDAERFFASLPDSVRKQTVIYCENYGEAGALKYYGISPQFKASVFSANGSFLLWMPDQLSMKHLIYISEKSPDKENPIFQHFLSRSCHQAVGEELSRQYNSSICFFQDIDSTGKMLLDEKLKNKKQEFRR